MRTIEIKGIFGSGHSVKMFDSIKELPSERYHELNKLILQDVGIGSDMDSVAEHFTRFHTLLTNKKTDEALQEAKNLHNNMYYMIQKINIKSFSFVAMVYSIDGKPITDFSQEEVKKNVKRLSQIGLSQSQCEDVLDDLKKKLTQSFEPIFLINMETEEQLKSLKKSKKEQKRD